MNAKKLSVVSLSLFVLSLVWVAPIHAQLPRLRVENNTYKVTIVSEFGFPVRVGIFGYSTKAQVRIDFDGGQSGPDVYNQQLYAGERVVCVWDNRGRALLMASVLIDSSGTLTLAPLYGGQAGAGAAEGAEADAADAGAAEAGAAGIPRLRVKPSD